MYFSEANFIGNKDIKALTIRPYTSLEKSIFNHLEQSQETISKI